MSVLLLQCPQVTAQSPQHSFYGRYRPFSSRNTGTVRKTFGDGGRAELPTLSVCMTNTQTILIYVSMHYYYYLKSCFLFSKICELIDGYKSLVLQEKNEKDSNKYPSNKRKVYQTHTANVRSMSLILFKIVTVLVC